MESMSNAKSWPRPPPPPSLGVALGIRQYPLAGSGNYYIMIYSILL